ncbi:hypothetical protein APTSU1_001109800 [Apodemus speciosus]|uniref:Uncharacterized protein n=1 Tax=Apodemus speciosus TaxID=105296 RepID=A0ABQ0F9C0_APOSI
MDLRNALSPVILPTKSTERQSTYSLTFVLQMRKLRHGLSELDNILMVEPRYKIGQFDFRICTCNWYTVLGLQ